MMVVLTQKGLRKAITGETKKPLTMTDEQWEGLDEKALLMIELCLTIHVLCKVLDTTTIAVFLLKFESLYMTKSQPNKIRLKELLCTFSMTQGSPIQNHLDEYNSIIIDLGSLDVKLKDKDKATLLFVSLPPLYKHFKEIIL